MFLHNFFLVVVKIVLDEIRDLRGKWPAIEDTPGGECFADLQRISQAKQGRAWRVVHFEWRRRFLNRPASMSYFAADNFAVQICACSNGDFR